jgi:predicted nicotinamide N-methyase
MIEAPSQSARDAASFVRAQTGVAVAPLVPELRLHLASEVTPLWHATEATLALEGLPPPYWAFAWPGGQALARYVLDRPDSMRGRVVLDLGAGCGIAAIAAAKAGAARVVAAETDPFAAAAIALNAALNGVAVAVEGADFLASFAGGPVIFPAVLGDLDGRWTVLVGDMCYERPLAERVIAFLGAAAARGATMLLADPGRAYLPQDGLDLLATYEVPTSLDLEDRPIRTTAVYRWRGGE